MKLHATIAALAMSIQAMASTKLERISFFCHCSKCCGNPKTKTATGTLPVVGRTIAAPRNIPLRSKVRVSIPGLLTNVFTVETRTNRKIDGWDIFRKTHRECVDLGIQWGQIEIIR